MKAAVHAALCACLALSGVWLSAENPSALDKYGGCQGLKAPGGGTGYFRIAKTANRWTFVSPEGNLFWLRAVYSVDLFDGGEQFSQSLRRKYDSPSWTPWGPFAKQAVSRLRRWHFNALGEYSTTYVLPVPAYSNPGNPEQMPFIRLIKPAMYSVSTGRVKEIIAGTDPKIYTGWRGGGFPDVFDPGFATFARDMAGDREHMFNPPLTRSPWLVGTTMDDRDELFGFGSGHPHLGWLVAVTAPTQAANPHAQNATYKDQRVYTKFAFRDFLRAKYNSISALDAAWGAHYTTWDSDGGWPNGQGVLDESGRNPWMGHDFDHLSDVRPAVRTDLDAFFAQLADHYFAVVTAAIRAYTPNHLIFSPASLGSETWPQVLAAAARYCDVVQVNAPPKRLDALLKAYSIMQKPIFIWTTFIAQPDSPLRGTKGWGEGYDYQTQQERGRAYAAYLNSLLSLRSPDGVHPVVGIDWWAYVDKVVGGERTNFGLITPRDNAYDGKEAVRAVSRDATGHVVGGEASDYGDFLDSVSEANRGVCETLRKDLRPGR